LIPCQAWGCWDYSLLSRFLLAAAWHHLSINYPALIVGHRAAQFWLDYLFIYFFQDLRIFTTMTRRSSSPLDFMMAEMTAAQPPVPQESQGIMT
jgi:hypothetical protein